jgi:Short-chain dehydrogenases of various substrate specificities
MKQAVQIKGQINKMKKAIIIGATSGIGKGLAKSLVAEGFKVGITGRRTELLENLYSEAPSSYIIKSFDITDTKTAIEKLEELISELGGLDLLILSSGTGDINEKLDFEIEKRTINTNVIGFTCIVDWAFHYFKKQEFGHLVAISSIGGLRGSRHALSYNATKAYQINYLEGLRQKATKIKGQILITDIRPGLVDTAMAKGEGLFWVMPVEKTVQQIFGAIKKKRKVVYVTKRWRVVATILKWLPRPVYDRM